jgi:hypothetical protein
MARTLPEVAQCLILEHQTLERVKEREKPRSSVTSTLRGPVQLSRDSTGSSTNNWASGTTRESS